MLRLLTDILKTNATKFAERPALSMKVGYRTKTFTYKELYDMARAVAVWLEQQGVGKGDNVIILAPNSPYWGILYWGCLLRGVTVVPLNVQSTAKMLGRAAEQTGAKLLFKHLYFKQDIPETLKAYDIEFLEELLEGIEPDDYQEVEVDPEDLVQILYTSGTTGEPKGVMLTHKNICSNLESMDVVMPIGEHQRERLLSILPLSHIFEQTVGFFLAQLYGAHVIYAHTVAAIRQLMVQYRITKMLAVPEFLQVMMSRIKSAAEEKGKRKLLEKMLNVSRKIGSRSFARRVLFRRIHKQFGGAWDMVASGGAPLDPELEREWNDLGIFVIQGYGLTETSPGLTSNSLEDHKYGSVGVVIPNVELKLSESNEVYAKGENVFQGYYKNPEKTKEAFSEDGWFKTGDIGEFDSDGFLFLKGREKYMILGPGGQNVFPEDVEEALRKIKGVKDCTVIGMEKPHGVEVHAVLLLDPDMPDADPQKIVDQANSELASYQHIGGYSVWPDDDFPRSATRKVQKGKVSEYLETHAEQKQASLGVQKTKLERLLGQVTGADVQEIHGKTRVVPELGLDSLMRVELVARIEQDFGIVLDETSITPSTTVDELDKAIAEGKPASDLPQLPSWPRKAWIKKLRRVFQSIIVPIIRSRVTVKVEGYENIKDLTGPVIYMPNHITFIDGGVVALAFDAKRRANVTFAAAEDVLYEEFGRVSWLADFLLNSFPLPRANGGSIKYGLNNIGQMLDLGYSVVIFPEGKVSLDGKPQELKQGTGLIATQMEVPIVPIKIEGAREIVDYGKLIPHTKGTVTVKFGKPLYFKRSESYEEARESIAKAMQDL